MQQLLRHLAATVGRQQPARARGNRSAATEQLAPRAAGLQPSVSGVRDAVARLQPATPARKLFRPI
eukprot:2162755-Alexandrium_andersonii.AAC.1